MKVTLTTDSTHFKYSRGLKVLSGLAVILTLATNSITTRAAVIAHWTFDASSGPTAHDSAGSFDGTLSSTGAAFVSGGVSGNAISLDKAANGFVSMGNVLGLTLGDFSIVAWAKMNAGDRTDTSLILSKQAAFSRNGYFLNVNKTGGLLLDDKASFYEGGIGFSSITIAETPISTTSVNDGNWHQVVAVYQASGNKSIYVDGAPAEDVKPSQAFVGNSVALLIGGLNFNGVPTGLFTGLIDDVQMYNHALSADEVDFLFQRPGQTSPACVAAPSGLVSWWQAESNALDSVGSNHGIVAGNTSFGAGQVGQAFVLDGTTASITVPASASLNVQSFTIEGWINPTNVSNHVPVAEFAAATGLSGVHLWISEPFGGGGVGSLFANVRSTSSGLDQNIITSALGLVTANQWSHVALSFDMTSGDVRLYVNGTNVAARNLGSIVPQTALPLNIGVRPATGSEFFAGTRFPGKIDELSLYNRALSAAEIQSIYNADGAGKCKLPTLPDCAQDLAAAQVQLTAAQVQLAAANATVASLQAQLATCTNALAAADQNIQALQTEIMNLLLPFQQLTHDFQTLFNDAQFQIPGTTAVEQMQNLVGAVEDLRPGHQQTLFYNLGGQKNRR